MFMELKLSLFYPWRDKRCESYNTSEVAVTFLVQCKWIVKIKRYITCGNTVNTFKNNENAEF